MLLKSNWPNSLKWYIWHNLDQNGQSFFWYFFAPISRVALTLFKFVLADAPYGCAPGCMENAHPLRACTRPPSYPGGRARAPNLSPRASALGYPRCNCQHYFKSLGLSKTLLTFIFKFMVRSGSLFSKPIVIVSNLNDYISLHISTF